MYVVNVLIRYSSHTYLRVVGVEVLSVPISVVARVQVVVRVVQLLVDLGVGQD